MFHSVLIMLTKKPAPSIIHISCHNYCPNGTTPVFGKAEISVAKSFCPRTKTGLLSLGANPGC